MDKVIQQNAACAEESASASEELNAQEEQMNSIVGELQVLVGRREEGKGVPFGEGAGDKTRFPAELEKDSFGGFKEPHEKSAPKPLLPREEDGYTDF